MKTKICSKCHEEKDETHFRVESRVKSGLTAKCKECETLYRIKNINNKKEYDKKYREINIKIISNKDKLRKQKEKETAPWKKTFNLIQQRCSNPKAENYYRYGGRGIQCQITSEELKEIWFRDNAYNLEYPSIDRKDNDGNYTFDNCQYIEMVDNIKKQFLDRQIKMSNLT
jgi:hypothetical protein